MITFYGFFCSYFRYWYRVIPFKKIIFNIIVSFALFNLSELKAQIWSSNPAVNATASCSTGSAVICAVGGTSTWNAGTIKAQVEYLDATTCRIRMVKCTTTFQNDGGLYVKLGDICATALQSGSYARSTNGNTITFSHGVAAGQSKTFYLTITPYDGNNPNVPNSTRYYSNPVTITATAPVCNPPTSLSAANMTHSSFTAQWNSGTGATSYNFRYAESASTYPSTPSISGISGTSASITSNAFGCRQYKFSAQSVCANGVTSSWSSDGSTTLSTYPAPSNFGVTSVTSTEVVLNWDNISGAPAFQVMDCNESKSYANGIFISLFKISNLTPATTYTFKVRARNQSTATCLSPFTNCITVTTAATIPEVPTIVRSQLLAGTTNTADIGWNIPVSNASYFKVYRSNSGANGNYTEIGQAQHPNWNYQDPNLSAGTYYYKVSACNAVGCSIQSAASAAVVVQATAAANLSLASAMSFGATNLTVGQTYTFSTSIQNTGNANWSGALYLKINGVDVSPSIGSRTYNSGATPPPLTYSFTPTTAQIGNNISAQLYYQTGGTGTGVSFPPNAFQNPITINIAATPVATTCEGCVQWSPAGGAPPMKEVCLASNYLCKEKIIISGQNASNNATKGILRKDLAVLVFKALFGSQTAATPADNFPVPFADMRAESNGNKYWFKAAKALAHLQFSDDRTPFDRTFINFRPNEPIARIDALKMIMEAWNIHPDASDSQGAATFCDVTPDKINFAYVQKAARLGIVVGNMVDCPCTTTKECFHPRDNMTRNQAFVIIYRLINKLKDDGSANSALSDKPTAAQLNDIANYFVPTNYTLANAAQTMGIEQANFNHYTKSSFSIGGRGLPLTFEHSYNSFLTEMPNDFFTGKNSNNDSIQTLAPLGIGWTHTYSSYILKVDGYTDNDSDTGTSIEQNPKFLIAWSNGSFQAFDKRTNTYDTEGVYDNLVQSTSDGNEYIRITSKDQMTYEFISSNAIKFYYLNQITDRNGNGLKMTYDGNFGVQRRLTEVYEMYANGQTNASNRKLIFSYDGSTPYLSSVTDNSINRTIYFNVNTTTKDLAAFTDAKNQKSTYSYDLSASAIGAHLLTHIQLPKGNTVTNVYEQRKLRSTATNQNSGRQSKTTVGLTPTFSNANEFTNSSVAVTQGGSTLTTNYKHDDKRRVKSATTPTTSVAVSAYGTGNNVFKPMNVRVTGAGTTSGSSVAMTYDPKGNPLTVTRTYTEGGTSKTLQEIFTYNTLNDITSHTDARGNRTTFEYLNGNLSRVIRPLNSITEIANRNAYYQVTSVRNPEGIVTNYAFDDVNGNLSNTTIQGTTISTSATYDNASRVKTVTDPAGKMTKVDYDPNDNVTKETDARNAETTYSYDRNDNLLTITNALQQVTTFGYSDAEDFLLTETFGGHTKTYDYNQDGSLKTFVRRNRSFAYTYDTKGRLETDGQVRLTYDDRNRIATATYQSRVTTYFYDDLDRMTAYEYAANGKTDRVEYTYDNNSNVQTIKYPNNRVVTYAYDALNRMTSVTDWNNRIVAQYDYKLDGRMNFVVYNNGVKTTYAYDNAGRVNGMTTKKSTNETLTAYTFGLDNVGNHTSEEMTEPLLATGLATLGNKNITNPAYSFNRMSQYDDRTFTHDGQGNISTDNTTTNTFDNYDNLTGVTGANPMTAQYDAGGNRRNLNQNNQNTRYVLDILGMSKVLMETDESTDAVQNHYIYGANGLICRLKPDATTTHYYHADFRGSIVAMTDANQNITHKYAYDPFGSLISKEEPTSDSNPFRYVGQYGVMQDATNRYFMRARYYDPSVGRFISEDPIAAANLYPYAGNNPITFNDPDGLSSKAANQIVEGYKNITLAIDVSQINSTFDFEKLVKEQIVSSGISKLNKGRTITFCFKLSLRGPKNPTTFVAVNVVCNIVGEESINYISEQIVKVTKPYYDKYVTPYLQKIAYSIKDSYNKGITKASDWYSQFDSNFIKYLSTKYPGIMPKW